MKLSRSTYTCVYCNKIQDQIGIKRVEINYYYFLLETRQLEDFHGGESLESENYFCINCQAKINDKIIAKIIE